MYFIRYLIRDLYKICNIDKQFKTESDIFITLFKSNDVVVLKALGNFIMKAFGKRKTLLYDNTVTELIYTESIRLYGTYSVTFECCMGSLRISL
jgi:hypothetical protein